MAIIILSSSYSTTISYVLLYLSSSFSPVLPWTRCLAWWGCLRDPVTVLEDIVRSLGHHQGACQADDGTGACDTEQSTALAQQFWSDYVLDRDHRGLLVLGDLSGLNNRLVGCQAAVWALVGLTLAWGLPRVTGHIF